MGAVPAEEFLRTPALPSYLTRFVGRATDLADLRRRVLAGVGSPPDQRLTVLVGLGGSGKTRLAVELAAGLRHESAVSERFSDGIWWVDLAPVTSPERVPVAVADAAGVPGLPAGDQVAALVRALRHRRALLLLDNCEHLTLACTSLLACLLPACAELIVVATSRTPLDKSVRGEVEGEVEGVEIALAALDTSSPDIGSRRSEAAELFYDRAGLLLSGYDATASDESAVAAICARLGGLPLAIELAAPWMRTLSASDLLGRIGHRLDLLVTSDDQLPERHRALLGVLDDTWWWLSTEEQRALRNLGAFVGGFSLEAAETVAGASLAALSTLTERSIIRRVPLADDDTRYVMHEIVRQYAVDRLSELPAADQDLVHTRHLEHLVTCTQRFQAARNGPDERVWLARMRREEANVDTALAWALERGVSEAALRLVAGMKDVWIYAGSVDRHHRAIAAALSQPWDPTSATAAAARAIVTYMAGWSEFGQGASDRARSHFVESLALNQQIGNTQEQAVCLRALSRISLDEGDNAAAERLARQSLGICRRTGDDIGAAWSVVHLADAAHARGDYAETERRLLDCVDAFHRLGIGFGEAGSLGTLGDLRRRQTRWAEALDAFAHSLVLARGSNATAGVRNLLRGIAAAAAMLGRPDSAAQLFGAADTWNQTYGGWDEPISALPDAERAAARAGLGEEAWAIAFEAGVRFRPEEALAAAEQTIIELREVLGAPLPAGLTGREAQVVALLAEGLSNADIAARLVVSPRTVDAHLRSIFHKLEVSSRTAAVHEAGRLGLRP